MPILELQKRARELGRIRIGHQVTGTSKAGKTYTRPEKLDRFRLTSASRPLLEKVAELYGGTVAEWTPKGGSQQWEVITDSKRIPILVPPQPVSQWLETWSAAGCVHRCDGVTNALTGEPCDPDDPTHLEARPTTRLSVVLRDVQGIGVWRLESHGWNAAIELPNAAEFLAQAGGYIEGHIALEQRTSKGENPRTGKPETRHFMVPIIEIDVTPSELLAGGGSITAPAVDGPVSRAALEAPRPDYIAEAKAASTLDEVRAVWNRANDAGHMTEDLGAALFQVGEQLRAPASIEQPDPAAEPDDEVHDAEVVDEDREQLWQQVLSAAGKLDLNLWDVETTLRDVHSVAPADATAEQLHSFLHTLKSGEVPA